MDIAQNIEKSSSENYLREVIFILSAWKGLIFLVSTVIFVFVIAFAMLWPPSYTSVAKIVVTRKAIEASGSTLDKVDYRVEGVTKEDLNSEAQLISSSDLITQVIVKLQKENKVFLATKEVTNQDKWLAKQVANVKSHLVVDVIPYSRVIDVSFTWSSAEEARLLLTSLLDRYLAYRVEKLAFSDKERLFVELSNDYMGRIKEHNIKLEELMISKNAVSPIAEIANNLEIRFSFEKTLGEGEIKRIHLEKKIALLDKKLAENDIQFFSFLENESINQFSRMVQELFIEKARTEGVFLSTSKAVEGLGMQLQEVYKNLVAEVYALKLQLESEAQSIAEQNEELKSKIATLDRRNAELKMAQLSMDLMENENKVLQMSFETFFKRKEEASFATESMINEAEVSLLSHPQLPLAPSFPNKGVLIPFGFIVACLSGIIVGFLSEFFDHSFKRPEDISNVLNIKHLISISDV